MQTVTSDQNERTLRIKLRDKKKPDDWLSFKARNIVFEGSWLMFFNISTQKILAYPFDLIEYIETNL